MKKFNFDIVEKLTETGLKERFEDVKALRLASGKKFAEIWKEEKDEVWESYL